jgi:hypothetical protein
MESENYPLPDEPRKKLISRGYLLKNAASRFSVYAVGILAFSALMLAIFLPIFYNPHPNLSWVNEGLVKNALDIDQVNETVLDVQNETTIIVTTVTEIQNAITIIQTNITTIEGQITEIQSDITDLNTDLLNQTTTLESEIETVSTDLANLNSSLSCVTCNSSVVNLESISFDSSPTVLDYYRVESITIAWVNRACGIIPTMKITLTRIGNLVNLAIPAVECTSNSSTFFRSVPIIPSWALPGYVGGLGSSFNVIEVYDGSGDEALGTLAVDGITAQFTITPGIPASAFPSSGQIGWTNIFVSWQHIIE